MKTKITVISIIIIMFLPGILFPGYAYDFEDRYYPIPVNVQARFY